MLRAILSLILFFGGVIAAYAQQSDSRSEARQDGAISGRVISDDGQPVQNAQIIIGSRSMKNAATLSRTVTTDVDGVFNAKGLAPGAYTILAMAPGLTSDESGAKRTYRIGDNVTLRLVKGGVITGRITDEFGQPMVGYPVAARKVGEDPGSALPDNVFEMFGSRETDDRGVYRLFGLSAGKYIVGLNASVFNIPGRPSPLGNTPPIFYPSANRAGATEIALRNGDEITGIDIQYRPLPGHSISGTVSGDTNGGSPVEVVILQVREAATLREVAVQPLMGSMKFNLPSMEDGEYLLEAIRYSNTLDFAKAPALKVSLRGADVTGIELKLAKLGSISGKVVLQGISGGAISGIKSGDAGPQSTNACLPVSEKFIEEILLDAKRVEGTGGAASIISRLGGGFASLPDKSGDFSIKGVEAGRALLTADLPDENIYLVSVTKRIVGSAKPLELHRTGITTRTGENHTGIEVRLASGGASLAGKVVSADGSKALPDRIRVHLVPADPAAAGDLLRHYEVGLAGADSFEFKNLSPGKYRLLARSASAKESERPLAWDPAELLKLRREAAAAGVDIELKSCQKMKGQIVHLSK